MCKLLTLLRKSKFGHYGSKTYVRFPLCIYCVNFIPHETNYPYDNPPDDNFGLCKKFGEVNLVTGIIEYDMAKNCRRDERKCGIEGFEYIEIKK